MLRVMLATLLAVMGVAATAQRPFTARDLAMLDRVSDPRVSADGQRVAYNLRSTDWEGNRGANALHLIAASGGDPVVVVDKEKAPTNPRWGGDGRLYFLSGRSGSQQVWRRDGNDRLDGGSGTDTLWGGEGNDSLLGGEGADLLQGEGGTDSLGGWLGDDSLVGGDGNDLLDAGPGGSEPLNSFELVEGGWGNDVVYGRAGDDKLQGGAGNDSVDGGTGTADTVNGGTGSDRCRSGETTTFCELGWPFTFVPLAARRL